MNYFILIIVAVVSFFIGWKAVGFFSSKNAEEMDEMREEAREALALRTEERKEKILEFMKSEESHQKELQACADKNPNQPETDGQRKGVTRTDIEKLLDVSSGTARKYLNILESENKIKQVGESGSGVYYVLID